jgi:hypothetical protein
MSIFEAVGSNSAAPSQRQLVTRSPEDRLQIEDLIGADHPLATELVSGQDVIRGLSQSQKTLPPHYFYDDRGSELFEQICELP